MTAKIEIAIALIAWALISFSSARLCPDGESECPESSTCCLIGDHTYGCCPLVDAVCCDDRSHCCPTGTKCDTMEGRCIRANGSSTKMKRKQKAKKILKDVICPDKRYKCPSGSTCCDIGQGRFGCCPLSDAVCCSDHAHCCPKSTICNVHEGRCINPKDGEAETWYTKFRSTKIIHKKSVKNELSIMQCRDGNFCSGSEKCCQVDDDQASCCPFKDGICCEGGRHCCPSGFECDSEEGRCVKEGELFSITQMLSSTSDTTDPLFFEDEELVMCPDGSRCSGRSKCCASLNNDGITSYSCCPLSQGVCCGKTCCPRGYSCAERRKCEKNAAPPDFDLFD